MCISPIQIKNPYLGLGHLGLNRLHDTVNTYINVPCGHCPACTSLRQSWINQRVQMESLDNYLFYGTLTYNEDMCPWVHIGDYNLRVPDMSDFTLMVKRLRNEGLKFSYIVVSEYGGKTYRPHYHFMLSFPKDTVTPNLSAGRFVKQMQIHSFEMYLYDKILSSWCRNVGSHRVPIYKPLLTYFKKYGRHNYELHFASPSMNGLADVSFYVSKYICKFDKRTNKLLQKIKLDNTLSDEETSELITKVKPRCIISKQFGHFSRPSVSKHIKDCLNRNPEQPTFYDIYTGKPSPLSRYYTKHFVDINYALTRFYNSDSSQLYSSHIDSTLSTLECNIQREQHMNKLNKFKKNANKFEEILHNKDF